MSRPSEDLTETFRLAIEEALPHLAVAGRELLAALCAFVDAFVDGSEPSTRAPLTRVEVD